ncbi:MAG: peptidase S41 [Bacteroidales bacterium]|jgi:C-terminal processing protease CtpA/Prc|nr:peptidase S41 [Bacteroidales bacterium]
MRERTQGFYDGKMELIPHDQMKRKILIPIIVIFSLLLETVTAQDNMSSREQRIYDLSLIWQEMKYNFVCAETFQQVNIDSLYLAYLPKVEQVTNRHEYFRVLNAFMAHFNEGHTFIYAEEHPDAPPPVEVINFDEKIIVSNIAKSMADKVPIGSEIIKVNHIPVIDFLKDSISPYIAASNSHWKFDKSVNAILYGVPQSAVKIIVKTPEGKENEIEMIRGIKEEMVNTTTFSPINIKIINEDIGYIHLASCFLQYVNEIDSVILSWVPQLRDCKGLIIDIRGNRGGGSRAWMMVAACLTESINNLGTYYSRKHVPAYKKWGENIPQYKDYYLGTVMEEIKHPPIKTNIPDSLQLHQPLIIISGPFVASASESFLALMKETGRATVIGTPSVGVLTEPMSIPLSEDFEARIAIIKYINPDGTDSNLTGILPDIEVKPNYDAYLKGQDNVLERAIEELQKQIVK